MKYFAALSLLRGVMSSPAAGYEMLQKRKSKIGLASLCIGGGQGAAVIVKMCD